MAAQIEKRAKSIDFRRVAWGEGMLGSRVATNRQVTLPMEYEQCEKTGRIEAFKLKWKPGEPNKPHIFWGSDVAKWLEAAAYSLASHHDDVLEGHVDELVGLIAGAQQPDGYLNIYFTAIEPEKRWVNLRDNHELYGAGHMMEAAVALAECCDKPRLLAVVQRYGDYLCQVFGAGQGQMRGYPGHPETELALVKLYRATGQTRYLDLAKFFVDERGRAPHYYDLEAMRRGEKGRKDYRFSDYDYTQAHKPVREQEHIEGHCVRALYLLSGMIDVAAETGDQTLWQACERLWRSAAHRRMYITGGVGSQPSGERFTYDYDLPNENAYAETCASISMLLASHRMLEVDTDGAYADVMERVLYNGILSGVSLSGDRFFYANPLLVNPAAQRFVHPHIKHRRQPWFGCACCPPNVARMLASLGRYVYSISDEAVYVHLYHSGRAEMQAGAQAVTVTQETMYPWEGVVKFKLEMQAEATFALALRLPGWCDAPSLRVNGETVDVAAIAQRGYAYVKRTWRNKDEVVLELPMRPRLMAAHPRVDAATGKAAIMRGPLVYCLEEVDNKMDLGAIALPRDLAMEATFEPDMLGGATVIRGDALRAETRGWSDALYRPLDNGVERTPTTITAVPYCLWANRESGQMRVWLNVV